MEFEKDIEKKRDATDLSGARRQKQNRHLTHDLSLPPPPPPQKKKKKLPPYTSSSSGDNLVDRGPPHQIFYEDARNALAAFQQAGDDESLAELAAAIDSLGGAAADAASLAAAAESRAEAAEGELESAKDSLLRLRAEFDNFRKRTEGEKAALAARAKAEAVEALVPLADSFDAAAALLASASGSEALGESSPAAKVASAYGGLQKQLLDAFRGVGVTPVPGEGAPFDPNLHEAVMRELDDSVPDGTVLQEFRRGYAMADGRLVRAAMVKVSYTEGDSAGGAGSAGAEAAVAGGGGGSESE